MWEGPPWYIFYGDLAWGRHAGQWEWGLGPGIGIGIGKGKGAYRMCRDPGSGNGIRHDRMSKK